MAGTGTTSRAARRRSSLGRAAALALGLHGAALGGLGLALRATERPAAEVLDEIDVDTVDEAAARALMDTLIPLEDSGPPRSPPPPPTQVVEQKGDGVRPTAPTRFIAEDDANPAREHRRSTRSTPVQRPAQAPGRVAESGAAHRAMAEADGVAAEGGSSPHAEHGGEHQADALPAPAEAGGTMTRGGAMAFSTSSSSAAAHHDPAPIAPAPLPSDPRPAPAPAGQLADDIAEAEPAEDAMVRARKSALAAFIVGVQHQVREHWNPKEVYRRADPTLTSLTDQGRRTELQLRVRGNGALEGAQVISGSGMAELDEEALAACQRAQPFPRPPPEVLDGNGRIVFSFGFELDMAEAAYRADLSRVLREQWRPSPAFRVFSGTDRMTTVRVLLTFDGVLVHAAVLASSGLEVLDRTVLAALKHGLHLPPPPPALGEVAGLVPLRLVFMHSVRGANDVRVMRETSTP
jgi:TonB family protein